MTDTVPRSVVDAFYEAWAARDADKVLAFLTDDVEWTISGPVDVLPFCGSRRGKEAVRVLIERDVPAVFEVFNFVTDTVLIDGRRVATLNRLAARRASDARVISYRLAHFLEFAEGKITDAVSLIDSFDAVEQVLGHPLAVHEDAPAIAGVVAV